MVTKGATLSRFPNIKLANIKKEVRKRHFVELFFKKEENTFGSISSSAIAYIILLELPIYYKAAPTLDKIIPMKTIHLVGHAISAAII